MHYVTLCNLKVRLFITRNENHEACKRLCHTFQINPGEKYYFYCSLQLTYLIKVGNFSQVCKCLTQLECYTSFQYAHSHILMYDIGSLLQLAQLHKRSKPWFHSNAKSEQNLPAASSRFNLHTSGTMNYFFL